MSREVASFRVGTRTRLIEDQSGRCFYCGRVFPEDSFTLDHIIPWSGDREPVYHQDNFVAACVGCNKRKGELVIFSSLLDHKIYPMIDVPYFFRAREIVSNGYKKNADKKLKF